ncbi:MAG: GNAT family N-acetyltransferase [Desulfobacterota bacterium]|nr:GNAT family N-acetyltransferase [Thermodesulfobacteriota bacterium]
MKMDVIEQPPRALWEEIAAKSTVATPYHAPFWAESLVSVYRRYAIGTTGFVFEDGTTAIFPMLRSRTGMFSRAVRYKSFGFGSYGGPIYAGTWDEKKTEALFSFFRTHKASIHFDGSPLWHHRFPAYVAQQETDTYVISLNRPLEEIFKKFSETHRRGIKTAEKKGVTVRRSASAADRAAYNTFYNDTLRRWGKKTIIHFPDALINRLLEQESTHVILWIAEVESIPIAGIIMLYWNAMAHYWLGASRQGYEAYHAHTLLQWHAIQDAHARSYQIYDFAPSGPLAGVEEFKRRFGAEKIPFVRGHLKR